MIIYTIRDKVAAECGRLFEAVNDDVAIRMTKEILKDIPFKSDYQLLKLGCFNTLLGNITHLDEGNVEIPIAWSPAEIEEEREANS